MKKLALLLSLLVLMSALCIPAFAKKDATLSVIGGNPTVMDFAKANYPTWNAPEIGQTDAQIDTAVYTGTGSAVYGNVRAMYDAEHLYFRLFFKVDQSTVAPTEVSIWLRETISGGIQSVRYQIQKDTDTGNYNAVPAADSNGWFYQGEVTTFSVQNVDNGMIIDLTLTLKDSSVLAEGKTLGFEVSATNDGGRIYAMNGQTFGANTNDWNDRRPRQFATMTFGAPYVPVSVEQDLNKDVMISTKTPDAVYSATVAWGAMQFVYDPEVEGADAWTANGNTVTVTNEGTRAIDVDVEYTAETEYTNITGSFDKNEATLQPVYLAVDNNNEATFELTLSGELLNAYSAVKVGTVAVTLTPAA